MTFHRYGLFGLQVASDAPLPDLRPSTGAGEPDVVITHGAVPRAQAAEPTGLSVTAGGALLNIPDVGRYLIADGDSILVEPAAAATDRNVRLFLLGSAFGAILHQRGLLPLHANIIDFDGRAVAFMGHSGAGKSTLANWFNDHGRPILGDDVCVVTPDAAGQPIAEPGLPRIRLWQDALAASGRSADDYEASFDDTAKYDVPTTGAAAPQPLPLAAVYVLSAAAPGQAGAIDRLTGIAAVQALVANTYRGAFLPLLGGTGRHLAQCVTLARRVPVFDLRRRWGLDVLGEEAAAIEAHVRAVLAERT